MRALRTREFIYLSAGTAHLNATGVSPRFVPLVFTVHQNLKHNSTHMSERLRHTQTNTLWEAAPPSGDLYERKEEERSVSLSR